MAKVHHKVKDQVYEYPTAEEAEQHAKQAVEQSNGKLRSRAISESEFEVTAAHEHDKKRGEK